MSGYNNPISPLTSTIFPSLEDFYGADPFHEPHLFVHLPWFSRFHWPNFSMVAHYANTVMIPDSVSLRSLSFPEWDLNFVFSPRDILRRPGELLPSVHIDFFVFFKNSFALSLKDSLYQYTWIWIHGRSAHIRKRCTGQSWPSLYSINGKGIHQCVVKPCCSNITFFLLTSVHWMGRKIFRTLSS